MISESGSTQSDHQNNTKCSMITQSGNKPFICGLCGCPFTQRDPLKRHMRTHTDMEPFKPGASTVCNTNKHCPAKPVNDSNFERITGPEVMCSGSCQDSTSTVCQCQNTALPDGLTAASNESNITVPDSLDSHKVPRVASETRVKRKLNTRTVKEKYDAIIEVERGVKSKAQIARELKINSSTLSTWLKYSDSIKHGYETFNPKRRKMRCGKFDELEYALMQWFKFARDQNSAISGPILISKAEQLAEMLGCDGFKSSTGWLDRFKERNGIVFRSLNEEAKRFKEETPWVDRKKEIMQTYRSKDIYNAYETSLFYKLLPENMCTMNSPDCCDTKQERLTVLVCANVEGSDKCQLLVVGKDEGPRCLKNVKTLPTHYTYNEKACMTAEIFESWISVLDKQMGRKGRRIALIVSSGLYHPNVEILRNINLLVVPPDATNETHPINLGVLQNLKVRYRKRVLLHQWSAMENNTDFTLNLLDAMRFLQQSWYCVTPVIINNCFINAGFTSTNYVQECDATTDEFDDIAYTGLASMDETFGRIQEFVNFDDDAALTFATLVGGDSDNDRISSGPISTDRVDSDDVEENEDKSIPDTPTDDQAASALATLCSYFESLEDTHNESKMLCALSRTIVKQQFSNVEKLAQRTVVVIKSEVQTDSDNNE